MKKYRFFIDFDKEETWLNEMAQKGWLLEHRTIWGTYCFKKIDPTNIRYGIDFRVFNNKDNFSEYLQLFSDSGWKHIYGTKYSGSQYFIPETNDSNEDIFSDNRSKVGRYTRLSGMWISLIISYTLIFIISYLTGSIDIPSIINPKQWYYTPGLWEKIGSDFWRAFLFETPFALGRGLSWLVYVTIFIASIYFTVRCIIEIKKDKDQD